MSDTSLSHLVVVGASAGGIEALSELVSTLPENFPAPVVIAQHLDPNRASRLKEVLTPHSALPVRTVTEHEPLEPGVVFVVPANRHVNITDSEIDLSVDSAGRPKPSVDLLMSSAAEVFGEDLIAVVLTGTGSDGSDGARDVRKAGGTVIIQDPETAEFGGMPGSLAPNTVDIVAQLDRIGSILVDLISGVEEVAEEAPSEDDKQVLEDFLEELRQSHGVDFNSYKTPTILRRLKRRMAATGSGSLKEYRRYLNDHPDESHRLVNTFLIKVTEFFRDPELFEYLKEEVLPELIEKARQEGRQLRIWSAGCATGEEVYSLAILVSEVLGNEAGLFDMRIFATDLDQEAIEFARKGIYPASALSGLSQEQVERYFVEEDGQYEIKKQVRGMIVFGEHDLARRSPFPRIDLVMSRNVLIYFTPELQRRALQLFAYSLRDDGYLVLGKAETNAALVEFFAPAQRQYKVYRRQGARFLMPPTFPAVRASRRSRRDDESAAPPQPRFEGPAETRRVRAADEGFLNRLPVGVVVVDRHYDIQVINAVARRLLSIRGAAVGEDLLHAMRGVPYEEVRRVVDSAFRDGESTGTEEFVVEEVSTGESCHLRLICHPQRAENEKGMVETVAIVVEDVTDAARARRELEEQLQSVGAEFEQFRRESEAEATRREAQSGRLIETNRQLEEANRELADLNGELQTAYEEALVTAEESQAAVEEVETLNEELQATNEELETLNEELQATIEELNATNDDLSSRSMELQELAQTREEERRASEALHRRLEAILWSISDAVIAVSAEGEVLYSNEIFERALGKDTGGETDTDLLGDSIPLDENGERLPPEATPQARAAKGESFLMRFAVDKEGAQRRGFEARGWPISSEDEEGGVIVIRELVG